MRKLQAFAVVVAAVVTKSLLWWGLFSLLEGLSAASPRVDSMLLFAWYLVIPVAAAVELVPTVSIVLPAFWWLAQRKTLNIWTVAAVGAAQGGFLVLPLSGVFLAVGIQLLGMAMACGVIVGTLGALAAWAAWRGLGRSEDRPGAE